MKREDIIKRLEQSDSTLLSFPDRGDEWGSRHYRGNCSGWIIGFLCWKYNVASLAELFAGSGTGFDICKDMGIHYIGADLNPNPVRPGILTVDAIEDEVPDGFYGVDMHFMHPPYSALINIPYAGNMYPDPTGSLSKHDLGQMQWDEFMLTLNRIILKYYAALDKGGRMAILMGDIRRQGRFYSMLADCVKPESVEQILIKAQHNTTSENRTYAKKSFVPIAHEYILVLKKGAPYVLDFTLPRKYEQDVRNNKSATWKSIVYQVLKALGSTASLSRLYSEIEHFKRAERNPHWKEKVRQTLQMHPQMFIRCERGVWRVAA